jgi:hypothetical protein
MNTGGDSGFVSQVKPGSDTKGATMTKLGTFRLTGKFGTKYDFNVCPRSDKFKAIGAVYFMSVRTVSQDGRGTHTWVYVGETGDLSSRPLNHERKACFDRYKANCILIFAEKDEKRRLAIETDLRQAYNPPCNRQQSALPEREPQGRARPRNSRASRGEGECASPPHRSRAGSQSTAR